MYINYNCAMFHSYFDITDITRGYGAYWANFPASVEAFESFFLHASPMWISYAVRWRWGGLGDLPTVGTSLMEVSVWGNASHETLTGIFAELVGKTKQMGMTNSYQPLVSWY